MMSLPYGQAVSRDRRKSTVDPYDPDSTVLGGWDDVDTLEIPSGFVASSSSAAAPSATRTQILTAKSLYCAPGFDVAAGDRIRSGTQTYYVDAVPEADTSPFTGWQPIQEIPLTGVSG